MFSLDNNLVFLCPALKLVKKVFFPEGNDYELKFNKPLITFASIYVAGINNHAINFTLYYFVNLDFFYANFKPMLTCTVTDSKISVSRILVNHNF